jgi:hypothetical protein
MKRIFVFFLSVGLSACATTEQGMRKLDRYIGQNADFFFKSYGMPAASYQFQDQSRVYRWSSGAINFQMPAVTTVNGSTGPAGIFQATATTSGGGDFGVECIVDIHTDQNNVVQSIRPIKDTLGLWVTSRCAEVFGS